MPKRKRDDDDATSGTSDVEEIPASAAATVKETLSKKDVVEVRKAKFNKRFKVEARTNEEVLEVQKAGWKSAAYKHFKDPEIVQVDGDVKYRFICKKHPNDTALVRARWDDSTSNLTRHVTKCEGKATPNADQSTINEYAHGATYSKHKMRLKLALWVARRHRPYAIVEDPELLDIFQILYAKVEVPHKTTVSRDVREIFAMTQKSVATLLQAHSGCLHLCIDGWTSPNVISFLGITVHRVVAGKMQCFILDFVKLLKGHTGEYLAEKLKECLDVYGISAKILAITADNASNNATLVEALDTRLGGQNAVETRVRCLAHILNLVVKAILSVFTRKRKGADSMDTDNEHATPATRKKGPKSKTVKAKPKKVAKAVHSQVPESSEGESDEGGDADDDDNDDNDEDVLLALETEGIDIDGEAENDVDDERNDEEYELDINIEASDEVEIDAIVAALEAEHALEDEEKFLACFAVTKLVELAKRVFHSLSIRTDLKSCCAKAKVDDLQLIRAIATHWNSLVQAIIRALKIRPAIDKLLTMPKYKKKGKKGLGRFKISQDEWEILEQLKDLLEAFLDATERVSHSNIPLLHETIPVIDILTSHLTGVVIDKDELGLARPIRVAAARGLAVLNKYYSATDESIMYRIAMIFHPKYKVDYFRKLKWKPGWISTAEDIVRNQWQCHYKPRPAASQAVTPTTLSARRNIFSDLDTYGDQDQDALDEWLAAAPLPKITNPLPWWQMQLDGSNEAVARMALDFLSVPAASTDVEWAFSRGGLTVSKRRHSLNDESTRAATVLSSWASMPGLIPQDELLELFANKSKCPKKKEPTAAVIDVDED